MAMAAVAQRDVFDRTVAIFKRFDINGDGLVTREELARVFKELDPDRWTEERLNLLMAVADKNKDGSLRYEEFVAWLLGRDRAWENDRMAAHLSGAQTFTKSQLVVDRRMTDKRGDLVVVTADQTQGGKLGVQVDSSDGRTLVIKQIREDGLLYAWIGQQEGAMTVNVGDRIVDVDGVKGNAAAMMKELKKAVVLDVTIKPKDKATVFSQRVSDLYDVDKVEIENGTFSTIRKAVHKVTGETYILKSAHKNKTTLAEFEATAGLMKGLDHPNIVKLYGVFEDHLNYHLVLEMCAGGELFDRILSEVAGFTEMATVRIMRQIFAAVGFLHSRSICHRDVRAEHLMLLSDRPVQNAVVKLVDFRAARTFDEDTRFSTRVSPPIYLCPELLLSRVCGHKCDMWSCGVIMYMALSGYPPYVGETDWETMNMIKRAKLVFPDDWGRISKDAKAMIELLLQPKPENRCSASEAIRHAWIENSHQESIAIPLEEAQKKMRAFCGHNKLKKAALHAIAHRLRDEDISLLQDMFALLDKNGDKMVTFYELKAGLERLGKEESTADFIKLMEEMDVDGSRRIDYSEFLAATLDAKHYHEDSACWAAFQVFDTDNSGKISKQELEALLVEGGEVHAAMGAEAVARVLRECDSNRDGQIDFQEFMQMMRGGVLSDV